LHKPLMEMEFNGILTDKAGIIKARKEYEAKIVSMQNELNTLVGYETSKIEVVFLYHIKHIKNLKCPISHQTKASRRKNRG